MEQQTWQCPVCYAFYNSLFDQVSHVRNAHNSNTMNISCVIKDCNFQFVNVDTYYKHVRRYHFDEYFKKQNPIGFSKPNFYDEAIATVPVHSQAQQVSCSTSSTDAATEYMENALNELPDPAPDCSFKDSMGFDENHCVNLDENQVSVEQNIAKYFMKLKVDHKLTQTSFNDVIKISQYALQTVVESMRHKVCNKLVHHNAPSQLCQEIDSIFDSCTSYQENLQSAYLQNKYISANFPYVVRLKL